MKGYQALRESAAWIDLSGRGKIRVTGEDRARLLHAMTTNDVQNLKPGDACYAFFLNAQGRILADVNILCFEDHFLLDTEPETARKVFEHLDKFIIADDVTLEDSTAELASVAVEGPAANGVPAPAANAFPRLTFTGAEGWFAICPAAEKDALAAALTAAGVAEADLEAANVVRIENGKPRYGDDISERFLAQETNEMRALHFSKGCYLGQEIVERVRSRAQIHRRLMPVHLETDQPPAAGSKLQAGGKDAAEITSAAYSPALGKTVALAYVRIDLKPGDAVTLGDVQGVVRAPRAQ
ncbi:MAG: folate-binding protein YgfZ [Acidobacteria bacterium]|nr:folate-binding protein YgfZ [Acidobacteriota bacterium]